MTLTTFLLVSSVVPPLLAVQPGWPGPGLRNPPCLTIAYLLPSGAPPGRWGLRPDAPLGDTPCRGCGGKILHPSRFPLFRGYDDKRVKPLSHKDWEELRRAVGLTKEELRMAMAISWREDRWRNRRHRNPRAVGLFGQIGGKSSCPVSQLRWAHNYALSRYGSWRAALKHHKRKGWW